MLLYRKLYLSFTQVYGKFLRIWLQAYIASLVCLMHFDPSKLKIWISWQRPDITPKSQNSGSYTITNNIFIQHLSKIKIKQ